MKKISVLLLSLFMFGIFANELPANFSKYQAHYTFKCDHGEKCAAAFDKYMNTPEVKAMNLEVDLYALMLMNMLWRAIITIRPKQVLCLEML